MLSNLPYQIPRSDNCKNVYSFGAKILRGVGNESLNSMYQHIHKQLYPNQIQTKDMLYGIQEEGNARKLYIEVSGNDVVETGMWVNDSYPFLASSPDGIILDSDKVPVGNLEIKCLKVMKEISVDDLIKNIGENKIDQKILSRQCFELRERKLILKENHMYFFQIQLQMLTTGLSFCDFVLHSPKGPPSIQRIQQNPGFQQALINNIELFWEKVYIPEYFEMRIPRRLLPFILN